MRIFCLAPLFQCVQSPLNQGGLFLHPPHCLLGQHQALQVLQLTFRAARGYTQFLPGLASRVSRCGRLQGVARQKHQVTGHPERAHHAQVAAHRWRGLGGLHSAQRHPGDARSLRQLGRYAKLSMATPSSHSC